jgi:hypothetical protein
MYCTRLVAIVVVPEILHSLAASWASVSSSVMTTSALINVTFASSVGSNVEVTAELPWHLVSVEALAAAIVVDSVRATNIFSVAMVVANMTNRAAT